MGASSPRLPALPVQGAPALLRHVARLGLERSGRRGRLRNLFALAGAAGLALAFGLPGPLGPQERGDLVVYGGPLVELAFTVGILAAVLLSFRTMDVLFRFAGVRPLRHLPLRGRVIALDRSRTLAREAVTAAAVLALPFLFCIPRAPAHALGAAALAALGPLLVVLVALGTNVLAGLPGLGPKGRQAGGTRGVAAMTGEVAGAWHLAPGIAFALTSALLLLAKLGIEELIRPLYVPGLSPVPRASLVVLSLAIVPALALGLRGYLGLARHAHALLARFEEGDIAQRDGANEEQTRALAPIGGLPGRLRPEVALLLRMNLLLLKRARPFLRAGTTALAAVLLFARWAAPDALPPFGWAAVACAWILVVLQSHGALQRLDGDRPDAPSTGLASTADRRIARSLAALLEMATSAAILSMPLLLVGGALHDRLGELAGLWFAVTAAAAWRAGPGDVPGANLQSGEILAALAGLAVAAILAALHPGVALAGASLAAAALVAVRVRAALPHGIPTRHALPVSAPTPDEDHSTDRSQDAP